MRRVEGLDNFKKLSKDDQIKLFKHWNFKYRTVGFTWIKLNKKNKKPFFGVGYYPGGYFVDKEGGVKCRVSWPVHSHVNAEL